MPTRSAHAATSRPAQDIRPLSDLVNEFLHHPKFSRGVMHVERLPAKPPQYGAWPANLDPRLRGALAAYGVERPYTHQAATIEHALAGRHTVVVTPTASGKTLCYNVPVVQKILEDPQARALYFFPTKALSHDQYRELYKLTTAAGGDIKVFTYDGDTNPHTRRALRSAGQIVMTNPDMLHTGILPHHTNWIKLFENLRYIVIDELHQYRGVFGSQMANVMRRLNRICQFYGSKPTFLCCSATIANPGELAQELTGAPFEVVGESGAPMGEKTFLFYNPPASNPQLNVRTDLRTETARVAARFVARGRQTIVFGGSRTFIEVVTTHLKRFVARLNRDPDRVCGYRSGYLPSERRRIEEGVKRGEILGVVSTNALELGIDIGGLDVSVLSGFPGSIASAWQQAGRAGRKATDSLVIYVGGNSPIDQFFMQNPGFFFGRSPEQAIINPDNLAILASHIKCAAFELPFEEGENFGTANPSPILQYLEDERVLRHSGGRWHYSEDSYPADMVGLREGVAQNFVILDTGNDNAVIGEVDYNAAPYLLHDHATYIHNARTYYVEKLDWDRRTAYVREKRLDYFTEAEMSVNIQVLTVDQEQPGATASAFEFRRFGDVSVTQSITRFKKVRFETQESIGYGPVSVPQLEIQTEAAWLTFRPEAEARMKALGLDIAAGLRGVAHLLRITVPVHVMCDPRDIGVVPQLRARYDRLPAITVWDRFAGGMGLARRFHAMQGRVLRASLDAVRHCPCEGGCPACVGPRLESGDGSKRAAQWLIEQALAS
ncbi:MAG: DEAD/DEAH box helicase [Sumerlaeia bacterium]